MGDPTTFAEWQIQAAPSWLQKPWGRAFNGALGALKDIVRQGIVEAVKCGSVSKCPDDYLDAHGWDRMLERGVAESPSTYRARLLEAFDAWSWCGTDKGIVDELKALGFRAHVIRDRGIAWIRDDTEALGGRFVDLGADYVDPSWIARGDYDAGDDYAIGDMVTWGGRTYVATSPVWSVTTVAPPARPWVDVHRSAFTHDRFSPGVTWCRLFVVIDMRTEDPAFFDSYTALAASFATYSAWDASGYCWASSVGRDVADTIRRVVRKWTQSGAEVVEIAVLHRGRVFGFPLVTTYADLPSDTFGSRVAKLEGW